MALSPDAADALAVFVIGSKGALRSVSLQAALASSPFAAEVVAPFVVRPESRNELTDDEAATLLFGRPLTTGEVGCWFAHRCIYEAASGTHFPWILVLEDDAGIPPGFWARVADVVSQLESPLPTIVSLFAQDYPGARQDGTSREEGLLPLPYPPTNTVAYLMNRAAINVALDGPRRAVSTADWPPWSINVTFLLLCNSLVTHEAESVIGARPDFTSGKRSLRRAAAVLSPQAWAAGRPYFTDRRSHLRWAMVIPARKAARRVWSRFAAARNS